MTAGPDIERLRAILARYNRRYERPHAVVEARQALLAELAAAGFTVSGPDALPGRPYSQRMRVEPGQVLIEGSVDIPNGLIRLEVSETVP